MATRQVVVEGGGANLYKVSESSGTFYVYHMKIGILSDTHRSIGNTRNLSDALTLIRSHSGKEIKSISDW